MPSLKTGRRSVAMETPRQSPTLSHTAEVLYLLSRGAQLEHPHMINVHFAAHQPGPTLRDVKARLIALRGKGMPDSFSWSYKRYYKDTFIWCDLFDDDFILPLSGSGEYVLKAMELFEVAQDDDLEYEELPTQPIRSARVSSPCKTPSRPSSRPELLHVENDVSMAIKKSLLLINSPADITSESSMDLNNQLMRNLSHRKRAPEVCSLEHSDVSSSGTDPSCEDVAENKIIAATTERMNASSQTHTHREPCTPRAAAPQEKQCSAGSQAVHREASQQKDVTTDCKELATTTKKDEATSFTPSSLRTPGSEVSARRRTWEKEIDKTTIYTQFVHHKSASDDEQPRSVLEEQSGSNSCLSGPEDPFLFGVLRKATRLGSSFRPRLCRGVDVVDSTRAKAKLHFRSKPKEDHQPNSANSPTEVVEKKSHSCYTSPEKQVREFKTLSEYFDSKERAISSSPVDKRISEVPRSVQGAPRATQLGSAQEDSSQPPRTAADSSKVDLPRPESRPFGNEALDASCRDTMELLAKLPTSRGVRRVHTVPQEGQKSTRSELKGNKQEVKLDSRSSKVSMPSSRQAALKPGFGDDDFLHSSCSIHGMDGSPVAKTPEESPKNVTTLKQRRPAVKKVSVASFEASTVSCRAKSTVRSRDEKIKTARGGSKESTSGLQGNVVEAVTKSQLPESFMFDSRALHSGNKQGLKMVTQVAPKVEVAAAEAPKLKSNEGAQGWPFEQPVRPRDFKSREDRPLTPGLTNMDWKRSLEEAVIHSEPPTNLVLHECSQCGRTFKLESLQVHMRGCRAVNKPKSSLSTQRRSSL